MYIIFHYDQVQNIPDFIIEKRVSLNPETLSFVMIKASRFFMIFIFSLILFYYSEKGPQAQRV